VITIIEGSDATGKTTFAKRLASETGAKYLHAQKPANSNWFDEYVKPITSDNMVLDRWHLGELVWPMLFGRRSLFDEDSFDQCNWELAKAGAQLILLTRPEKAIVVEMLKRKENDQIESVLASRSMFIEVFKKVKYLNKRIIESGVVQCTS
jgi:adenylate kinase family enzyme